MHDLDTITQALVTHLGRAAEKLRKQGSAASSVTVFIHTNRHKRSPTGELAKQYYGSQSVELPRPSNATPELVNYAVAALKRAFKFGYEFQKVGVMLTGLVPADHLQADLFRAGPDARMIELSATVDKLNCRHGRDRIRLASAGYDPSWHHKRQWMSPRYTTQWEDILRAG